MAIEKTKANQSTEALNSQELNDIEKTKANQSTEALNSEELDDEEVKAVAGGLGEQFFPEGRKGYN